MFRRLDISAEFISAERLVQLCDWAYWTGNDGLQSLPSCWNDGDLVYCHTDHVFELFRKIRLIPRRVILVTNESDHAVTERHFASRPWNVVEWFGANALANDLRCHVIPRGLANRSCHRTIKPEQLVKEITSNESRTKWLYVNHRIETNPEIRKPIYEYFRKNSNEGWATIDEPSPVGEIDFYLQKLKEHRFICCPPGNGVDTHRMWEALYTQTIPIVLRTRVTEAFADLPIVLVNSYTEIDLPFLQQQYNFLSKRAINLEKLQLSYWHKQLLDAKDRALATPHWRLIAQWLQRKL